MRAKPGAKRPALARDGETVVVTVRERAVDGRANEAVLVALAAWLDLAPSRLSLERGAGGRLKTVAVTGIDDGRLAAAIAALPEIRG